jgi:hypothetical protein
MDDQTGNKVDEQEYGTYDEAPATTAGIEAFEAAVDAEPAPAKEVTLLDAEVQKIFDGQEINQLIQQTRAQIASGKVAFHLAQNNLGQGKHPNQIREGLDKLQKQLDLALELAAELEASEAGIGSPSPIEIADAAAVVGLNRAQRRHPARG